MDENLGQILNSPHYHRAFCRKANANHPLKSEGGDYNCFRDHFRIVSSRKKKNVDFIRLYELNLINGLGGSLDVICGVQFERSGHRFCDTKPCRYRITPLVHRCVGLE